MAYFSLRSRPSSRLGANLPEILRFAFPLFPHGVFRLAVAVGDVFVDGVEVGLDGGLDDVGARAVSGKALAVNGDVEEGFAEGVLAGGHGADVEGVEAADDAG